MRPASILALCLVLLACSDAPEPAPDRGPPLVCTCTCTVVDDAGATTAFGVAIPGALTAELGHPCDWDPGDLAEILRALDARCQPATWPAPAAESDVLPDGRCMGRAGPTLRWLCRCGDVLV